MEISYTIFILGGLINFSIFHQDITHSLSPRIQIFTDLINSKRFRKVSSRSTRNIKFIESTDISLVVSEDSYSIKNTHKMKRVDIKPILSIQQILSIILILEAIRKLTKINIIRLHASVQFVHPVSRQMRNAKIVSSLLVFIHDVRI